MTEDKMMSQWQLLDSAQQALSKREFSSSVVISLAMANAMVLVKNHIPDFDAERAMLVDSAYHTTHHFVSLYDFFAIVESDDNNNTSAS
jgi:hypothetical protein